MNLPLWRMAGVAVLCLAVGAPAYAEGPQDQLRGSSNGGQRGQGGGNAGPGQPQGGGQYRPQQGGNQGQWQGRPPQGNQGQWQGRPGGGSQNQWQGNQPEQGRPEQGRPDQGRPEGGQQDNRPPIIGKPDAVRQTQAPLRGSYPDLRRDNDRRWEGGRDRWPGGHGGGWGPGPQYRPGQVIDRFPGQNYRVPYRGQDYYYSGGYWYRPQGPQYVVIEPPRGVRVRVLPDYAQRMWIGSSVFFVAAGTYYQWADNTQEYVVVNPPVNASTPQPAPTLTNYDVAAYPAQGQSPQQIAQDQYECKRWAVEQSRFDPASATYAPSPEVVSVYRQSLANCFASRGYTVN
ncbi:DUF6515 family protein [Pseudomonas sp. CFBP 13727]|uniref:DUF6515 family protein n=1 Tax=Pseudomonas sp. CFBP 13727 TaxID=2775295 RepID=UPI001782E16E|nr:DUF6515 family protein [Pseudomonas sp. CFBP 13727]MBD8623510.1 glycine zipper family protein [Pseudomonas sp. CFBP 13727]